VNPTDLTLAEAAEEIRTRRLSPLELTEAYLRRIERANPALNAYVTVTTERALADARRATEEIAAGRYRGPLHGIPIGLKDLYDTAGIRTTAGSKVHADHVPTQDSTVARRLAEAGAVLLGKQNTHEYAWGVTTNNPHYGPTRNPWDPTRIPGGSSGGSGAATAARLACASMGTDTGGSIRVPASLCGVVGLKPTYGRVSKAGVFPMSYLLDHAGPLTRTVEDAALVLGAIAGYDAADFATVPVPVDDYRSRLAEGIRGLRIGVPRQLFFAVLTDEVRSAVEAALGVLGRLGATVVDVDLPGLPPPILGMVVAEAKHIHADTLAHRPGDLGADLRAFFEVPALDGVQFAEAVRLLYAYGEEVRRVLEPMDLLVTPTTPLAATRIGEETVAIGPTELPVFLAMTICTVPFNVAHLPALSVPCGFTAGGLPMGLQLVGRPFDEATVLRAGHAYERATEWHTRRPPEVA
jgi:aspartyl-tRNA(Asn)/glutamyl-tRNA(Gln) amidotransferase subunit A